MNDEHYDDTLGAEDLIDLHEVDLEHDDLDDDLALHKKDHLDDDEDADIFLKEAARFDEEETDLY